MLKSNEVMKGLNNEEVIALCKEKKVSLDKYSKLTNDLKILNEESLDKYLL